MGNHVGKTGALPGLAQQRGGSGGAGNDGVTVRDWEQGKSQRSSPHSMGLARVREKPCWREVSSLKISSLMVFGCTKANELGLSSGAQEQRH